MHVHIILVGQFTVSSGFGGKINDDTTRFHGLDHGLGDQFRGGLAWN